MSSEAEQSVLGGMIRISEPSSPVISNIFKIIKETSFTNVLHKSLFRAIRSLVAQNKTIDLISLDNECKKQGRYDEATFVYIAQIIRQTISAANVMAYASIVREASISKYAQSKLNEALAIVSDESQGDIYQRVGLAETLISEIANQALRNEEKGLRHISEIGGEWFDDYEARANDGCDKKKFTTGIESLDDVLGVKGMRRGSLVVVGARPKMGKTALLTTIANHFALELKQGVATFSLEMPGKEIWERSLCADSKINPSAFYDTRGLTNEHLGRLDNSMPRFNQSNMFVDDTPAITLRYIQKETRNKNKETPLGLICVDYLTLMEAEKADRNDLAYGMITKGLKNLAKELNCVVLLLTQLNRNLEQRQDKRPMPSDSRDTGQIEQDCDLWIGLYKESVYDDSVSNTGLTEVIVRLNRHGGTGTGFVEMKQGFFTPVTLQEGAQALQKREESKKSSSEYKYKGKGNAQC